MTYDEEFASADFEEAKTYPTLFGVTVTPKVSGILIAILGLGGAFYLGSQFVLPAYQSFQERRTNVEIKEADLQQKTETVRQVDQVIASLDQAKAVNIQVKALFSDQQTLDTLLLDLNQLIVQTNAQLVTFTPDYTASGPVSDGSLGPELNGKLKRQVTSVAFEGDFNQTLTIMRNMERLQTFLVVSNFSAELPSASNTSNTGDQSTSQPQQDQIRSAFQLYAYVPLTPEEAAAAAKAAPAQPADSEQPAAAQPQ